MLLAPTSTPTLPSRALQGVYVNGLETEASVASWQISSLGVLVATWTFTFESCYRLNLVQLDRGGQRSKFSTAKL